MTRDKWVPITRVAISRGLITILFLEYHFTGHPRMCSVLKLTELGIQFLTSPKVLSIARAALCMGSSEKDNGQKKKREVAQRSKQFLPRLRQLFQDKTNWKSLTHEEQYQYPGFQTEEGVLYYCASYKAFRY